MDLTGVLQIKIKNTEEKPENIFEQSQPTCFKSSACL